MSSLPPINEHASEHIQHIRVNRDMQLDQAVYILQTDETIEQM